MQEEFLYLENKASSFRQLCWKVPLGSLVMAVVFLITPLSHSQQAFGLLAAAVIFSLASILTGISTGKNLWFNAIRKNELKPDSYNYPVPARAEAYESLLRYKRPDFFSYNPLAIGFSEGNGEALWLEEDSLNLGLSVFSQDDQQHLNFSFSLLLQHLLQAGSQPAVIIDLRVDQSSDQSLSRLLQISGRSNDLLRSYLDPGHLCFNPFSSEHSTEAKAKKLILAANLLLNNSVSGSSLGAETEDFFFRLARCLDSYNSNWTLRHLTELLQDFQTVSAQLSSYFHKEKKTQSILDLGQLEKYLLKTVSESNPEMQNLIKIFALGLTAQFRTNAAESVEAINLSLKKSLSLSGVLYFTAAAGAERSSVQLAAGLLAEELKSVLQTKSQDQTALPMILVISDKFARIANVEALQSIAQSEEAILIYSTGSWESGDLETGDSDLIQKKAAALQDSIYFNFNINKSAKLTTEQGSIPAFWPIKLNFF